MWVWLQERTHEGGGKGRPAAGEGIGGLVMNQDTYSEASSINIALKL